MNKSKSLVIKTALNTIYVANGRVSCVRCATTGRFVAVKKFANIVNSLIVIFISSKGNKQNLTTVTS